jgi:hypothetical protein
VGCPEAIGPTPEGLVCCPLLRNELEPSGQINLKTAVSHRGTETAEAADKELYLRNVLKNCYALGEDKASENHPLFHLFCALRDSVAFQLPVLGLKI